MGITRRKATTRLAAAVSAAALAIGLSGCGVIPIMPTTDNRPAAPQEDVPSTETSEDAFAVSDLMFAAMMIPHHQQAVDMSRSALEISDSPEIRDLATRIRDGQLPEIDQMQGWLDDSGFDGDDFPEGMMGPMGQPSMDSMEGMPGMESMGGMATEEEIAALNALASPGFDQEFLRLMIDHHEGALVMIRMINNSAVDEVRQLAEDIDRVQRAEIAEMENLQERLASE